MTAEGRDDDSQNLELSLADFGLDLLRLIDSHHRSENEGSTKHCPLKRKDMSIYDEMIQDLLVRRSKEERSPKEVSAFLEQTERLKAQSERALPGVIERPFTRKWHGELCEADLEVFKTIADCQISSVAVLRALVNKSAGTISRTKGRLESRGLIEVHSADSALPVGRTVHLYTMSADGRGCYKQYFGKDKKCGTWDFKASEHLHLLATNEIAYRLFNFDPQGVYYDGRRFTQKETWSDNQRFIVPDITGCWFHGQNRFSVCVEIEAGNKKEDFLEKVEPYLLSEVDNVLVVLVGEKSVDDYVRSIKSEARTVRAAKLIGTTTFHVAKIERLLPWAYPAFQVRIGRRVS
jgi:hypothetical protein